MYIFRSARESNRLSLHEIKFKYNITTKSRRRPFSQSENIGNVLNDGKTIFIWVKLTNETWVLYSLYGLQPSFYVYKSVYI